MIAVDNERTNFFAWHAVCVGAFTPVIAFVLFRVAGPSAMKHEMVLPLGLLAALIIFTGFGCSAWALRTGWKQRDRSLQIRALLALLANGYLIVMSAWGIHKAIQKTAAPQPPQASSIK